LDLVLENVSLTYDDGSAPVLSNLTLRVPAGCSLGLVGRSGSGKTSIGRLALRLIEPTEGSILVGGVDLTGIDETSFRQRITSVPQDVQLFPGTVRDNVTMFTATSDVDVLKALRAVGLGPWLADQAQGLDSPLLARKGGAGLSAGEAQLLALARALVRSPSIVVLDEATSRIDPATQALISEATESLLQDRTSVVIAHRLETLSVCDYIAVLDHGEVVEHGLRTDLAANPDSRFARLLLASRAGQDDLGNDDDPEVQR
jgi:ATP-binding cassette, subfamily B, bacterial